MGIRRRMLLPAGVCGVLALGVGAAGAIATSGAAAATRAPRTATTIYVAPKTTTSHEPAACKAARYHTIPAGLKAAKSGDTVKVCAGTYHASTTITLPSPPSPQKTITTGAEVKTGVHLVGMRGATINAKGLDNGVTFFGASDASVSGLTIENAIGEGVLAALGSSDTISHNVVVHNDNGGAKSGWFECAPNGQVPGDCGEGIHLLSTFSDTVSHNRSMYNSGGILLTDEFGPNHANTVTGNLVEDNLYDCGVTVVSHNAKAVNSNGVPQPQVGGTFDNTISHNEIISNGTIGEGGGVIFASAVLGGGAYDNVVTGNEIVGNGLAGVTIHQHAPVTDVSGNIVVGNWIGTNNVDGDPGTGDMVTTGVLVDNGGTHKTIKVTVKNNTIAFNTYGIYDDAGNGLVQTGNKFIDVSVHVKR